jgi:hypothetical protein
VSKRAEGAIVGVVEHVNTAVLVTLAPDAVLLDRRAIVLTVGLPTHPHHHEGSWAVGRYLKTPGARTMSLAEAAALVERVRDSAVRGARASLDALAASIAVPVTAMAIRACPDIPASIQERITDHRAQTIADSVMYREALAAAAEERGWAVHWYDRDRVRAEAIAAVEPAEIDAMLTAMGRSAGPPWRAQEKLAAMAALAAGLSRR